MAPVAARASESSPIGLWWADQGAAQVEISERNGVLEGTIVWLRAPFGLDGCPLRDVNNPDEALRSRPVLGLRIIDDLRPGDESGVWSGGSVYEPNSGRRFRLSVRLEAPDRLELRGFIGFELIGRTQTWFRVPAPGKEPRCPSETADAVMPDDPTPPPCSAARSRPG